jgi:uncharacterized membrane protein SirB2
MSTGYQFNLTGIILLLVIVILMARSPKLAPYLIGVLALIVVAMVVLNYKGFIAALMYKTPSGVS